jgi:hypothetical protein
VLGHAGSAERANAGPIFERRLAEPARPVDRGRLGGTDRTPEDELEHEEGGCGRKTEPSAMCERGHQNLAGGEPV